MDAVEFWPVAILEKTMSRQQYSYRFGEVQVREGAPGLAGPTLAAPAFETTDDRFTRFAMPIISRRFTTFAMLLALLATGAFWANPAAAQLTATRSLEAQVDEIVSAEMQKQNIVGIAVGLIDEREPVLFRYYGFEDLHEKIPVTGKTMFRWASISKPVTAVAAMQLVEDGKLDLAVDVCEYCPEFPAKEHTITCRDLLCHQSGIPHYMPGKVFPTKREYEVENPFEDVVVGLDKFNQSPLLFEPGAQYSYTTYGYMLLGAVVQKAGDQKFAEQARQRIFEPLGMDSMQPDYQWIEIPHRTIGYRRFAERRVLPSRDSDVSWKLAGGGFISNIGDLTRFAVGLLNKRLLSEESYKKMWTPQQTADGEETSYALGFGVSKRNGLTHVGHSGSQEKTRTLMVFQPETGRGVTIMCNTEGVNLRELSNGLLDVIAAEANAE